MSLAAGFLVLLLCLAGCNPKDVNSVTAQASGQESQEKQEQASGSLNLHYLDVGQGNAVLVESQGRYMLIDGGARKASSFVVSYLEKQGVKELDYLLISHFDEDHLAGAIGALHKFPVKHARKASSFVVSYLEKQGVKELDYLLISHFDEDHLAGAIGALHKFPVKQLITPDSFVVSYLEKQGVKELDYLLISHFDEDHLAGAIGALHKFPVKQLITPDYETDSSIYQSYVEVVEEKQYQAVHPKVGDEFTFGTATFRIISPTVYGHEDENQDSVGIVLKNGENEFLIGGDIGLESEKEILNAGIDIQADIMLMN